MRYLYAFIFLAATTAQAQKVYEDEYIFTRKEATGISTEAAEHTLRARYNIFGRRAGLSHLGRPRKDGAPGIRSLGPAAVVDYNSNLDRCRSHPVRGYDCEPNYAVSAAVEPTDKFFKQGSLWGLNGKEGIRAPAAWNKSVGTDIVVAVIDTGSNFAHPDLAPNIWRNPREVAGNGRDDDGNGYVDDSHGYNAIDDSGLPVDDNGHGTHVAGTICAYGGGGGKLVGVSWNCKILTVKFLGAKGGGSLFDAIKGIEYLIAIKEQYQIKNLIANNSWGGGGYSRALDRAIGRAAAADILFVAAAGNEGINVDRHPHYPSRY